MATARFNHHKVKGEGVAQEIIFIFFFGLLCFHPGSITYTELDFSLYSSHRLRIHGNCNNPSCEK